MSGCTAAVILDYWANNVRSKEAAEEYHKAFTTTLEQLINKPFEDPTVQKIISFKVAERLNDMLERALQKDDIEFIEEALDLSLGLSSLLSGTATVVTNSPFYHAMQPLMNFLESPEMALQDFAQEYIDETFNGLEAKNVNDEPWMALTLLAAAGDAYIYFYFFKNPARNDGSIDPIARITADILVGGLWFLSTLGYLTSGIQTLTMKFETTVELEKYIDQKLNQEINKLRQNTHAVIQKLLAIRNKITRYGKWYPYVKRGEIAVGMPDWIVKEILGSPAKVNKGTGPWGTYEQWVYERYNWCLGMYWPYLYVYFVNGELVSWEEVQE